MDYAATPGHYQDPWHSDNGLVLQVTGASEQIFHYENEGVIYYSKIQYQDVKVASESTGGRKTLTPC